MLGMGIKKMKKMMKIKKEEDEEFNGGLEDIIEDGEKEKEDLPLIKDEDAKED